MRFDTLGWVLFNGAGILIWVLALVCLALLRFRTETRPGWLLFGVAMVNISIGGVYLPLGPLYALSEMRALYRSHRLTAHLQTALPLAPKPIVAPPSVIDRTSRRLAAFTHFGIPVYGPILPLILGKRYRDDEFIRGHAREALCFQIAVSALWIPIVVGAAIEQSFVVALSFLALGLLVECMQARRAITARAPLRLTSFMMR